jgi:hypothetical protein
LAIPTNESTLFIDMRDGSQISIIACEDFPLLRQRLRQALLAFLASVPPSAARARFPE